MGECVQHSRLVSRRFLAVVMEGAGDGAGGGRDKSRSGPGLRPCPSVPTGPAFYVPPSPLPSAPPGALVWARPLTGTHVLPDAATNTLILYHSTAVRDGADVAESAMVALPHGAPPAGGWPVIAWAHGTAGGVADACVVSADDGPAYPGHDYTSMMDLTLDQWVKRGFVVVQPDYEGFGPPGRTPTTSGSRRPAASSTASAPPATSTLGSVTAGWRWVTRWAATRRCSPPRSPTSEHRSSSSSARSRWHRCRPSPTGCAPSPPIPLLHWWTRTSPSSCSEPPPPTPT